MKGLKKLSIDDLAKLAKKRDKAVDVTANVNKAVKQLGEVKKAVPGLEAAVKSNPDN